MNLTEKNQLYLKQKAEIERLNLIIDYYQKHQIDNVNVRDFCKSACYSNHDAKVIALDLYSAYQKWCIQYDLNSISKKEFYAFVQHYGFKKRRGAKNCIYFYGISLKEGE